MDVAGSKPAEAFHQAARNVADLGEPCPFTSQPMTQAKGGCLHVRLWYVQEVGIALKMTRFTLRNVGETRFLVYYGGGNAGNGKTVRQNLLVPSVNGPVAGQPGPDQFFLGQLIEDPIAQLGFNQISMGGEAA